MATIKDVAKLSGVSPSTVSIILNGNSSKRKISEKTQKKVMNAIKELNYHPNISARKLRNQNVPSNPTIALYWSSDIRVNIISRFLRGLQDEIIKSNYNFDIVICPYKTDFIHLEKGINTNNIFNAAIIANISTADMEYLNATTSKLPIILFNRLSDKYSSVNVNNYKMGEKAANLFTKKGHKKASAILTKSLNTAMDNRNKGFIETCYKNSIEISSEYILEADNSIAGGVKAAKKLLKLTNMPKALFCNSDSIALGALHIFNKKRIKVPEDIEIIAIGMNDSEHTEFSTPPITIVDIPIEKMAGKCIELISNLLNQKLESPTSILFDGPLIMRDSCKVK
ncbi:LacI family DNA-binding transcriptional regulator [Clostridium guangxiense]|uniref:LacI family DNA-binding transcriptional regulator n=1 Tax=Clostridium guangxiense TaxID=1662055 RepID=UPI001E31EB0A|nr:LacI family DNA-binding transcriptional regulator [Clostridium guangxiense]MCD2349048.1 LacI family DNA-binding transcriptional regulator [Clostridium guangxiense]